MRIGFDISPLEGGHAGRGTGAYTRTLLAGLKQYGNNLDIFEFSRKKPLVREVDLIHYPYFDPFFLTLPMVKTKRTVVTVHDLIPITYSEHFPRGIRGELKWQIQRQSLKHTAAIITDSVSSSREIARHVPYDVNHIRVIYLAPDTHFSLQSKAEQDRVRKQYSLPNRFVLYVGDVNWNKNIPGLIRGMKDIDCSLVLVGKAFHDPNVPQTQEINNLINSLSLNDKIIRLGFVSDENLPALYSSASAYVQPSYAEGFGLPVLESMACGTLAVVSRTTSLQEIAGPSILIDPESPAGIASGIKKALSLKKETYGDSLRDWVAKFTWKKTAQQTIRVYESFSQD